VVRVLDKKSAASRLVPARFRYLQLKAEWPAAYLVHTSLADELNDDDGAPSLRMSTQSAPRVCFQIDHRAFARLIELVLESHKRSPERSRQGSTGMVAVNTMGADEYLSALLWTLELTGNAVSSQPRRSFLPSRAPTAEDLAVYLNHCAVHDEHMPQQTAIQTEEPEEKKKDLDQSVEAKEHSLTPVNAYTVGLSTLPLHHAEKLLPAYLSPLVSELSSEAQEEVRHRRRAGVDGASVVGSDLSTNRLSIRLLVWLQSSWVGAMVGATTGMDHQDTSRTVSSEWLPPEAAFPCVVRTPYLC
jgi:hypothetical protein